MLGQRKGKGFTIIELLIVIAIIAFLSAISLSSFFKFLAKSKRSEAYMTLRSLHMAQRAYWLEHGKYTTVLQGQDGIGWKPEGTLQYTYGFPGAQGVNNFVGALKTPGSVLTGSAGDGTFTICAAGDIDGDGTPDIITIDHTGTIRVVSDDLA